VRGLNSGGGRRQVTGAKVVPRHDDVPARREKGDAESALRRSARTWQPSREFLVAQQNKFSAGFVATDVVDEDGLRGHQEDLVQDVAAAAVSGQVLPRSHRQAMSMENADSWRAAEISEVRSHCRNSTFGPPLELKDFAPGQPVRCFWIFAVKADGTCKARIAMLGSRMRRGVHFEETYAPVPRLVTLRVFLVITAREGRVFSDFDIKTAFLTVSLDVKLDILLPEAFNEDPGIQIDAKPEAVR
jgi:hypothetical protein